MATYAILEELREALQDFRQSGKFVIASLEETSPAQDDATYSGTLESDGEPEVYPGKPVSDDGE